MGLQFSSQAEAAFTLRLDDNGSGAAFAVRVERSLGQTKVICVRGEIDMVTAPRLENAFVECGQSGDVVVDLTEVTFFDSSALKVLAHNANKLRRASHQIRLQGLSDDQRKLVRLTGLDAILNIPDES